MRIGFVTCSTRPDITPDDTIAAQALRTLGATVAGLPWDDPTVQWHDWDRLVIRSTWNYHLQPAQFKAWLDARQKQGIRLWNPAQTIRWNLNKTYLRDLAGRGFSTPDTLWIERGSPAHLEDLLSKRCWDQAVIKPVISASAYRTERVSLDTAAQHQPALDQIVADSGAMIQEYRPEVAEDGEWSLIFFRRRFSHAVLKRTGLGDFRVQAELGGSDIPAFPNTNLLREARQLLDSVPGELLYARVDGIQVDDRLMVIELELIEPVLFFASHAPAAARFAAALLQDNSG